jgi:hypothetical protein
MQLNKQKATLQSSLRCTIQSVAKQLVGIRWLQRTNSSFATFKRLWLQWRVEQRGRESGW